METVPYSGKDRCCVLNEGGDQCQKKAKFWVGSNAVDDYTHVCAEHVQSVKNEGDSVHALYGAA